MKYDLFQLIGYLGAFLFILSYYLLSIGKLTAQRPVYQLMNIFGALFLIINALNLSDMPTLLVNGVWFMIGLFSLMNMLNSKK